MTILLIGSTGCLTKTEIIYARATRAKEETKGFMRLAQNKVRVNVVGTDKVSKFSPAGGYILVFEDDLSKLIKNTKELQEIKKKKP